MNLPNKITCVRLALVPVFVFFYLASFIPYGKLIAALVFALACFTDFLDGKIARSRGLVTNLGKFLDTIADKVLVMAGLICIIAVPVEAKAGVSEAYPILAPQYIAVTATIIILAREFIISAFRQIAATKNVVLAADMYGKVKAVFQFITLIFYLVYAFVVETFADGISAGNLVFAGESLNAWQIANTVMGLFGYLMLAITVVMTIVSAIKYVTNNIKVLKDTK